MKLQYLNVLALLAVFATFSIPSVAKIQCTSCFWLAKEGCPTVDSKSYGCEKHSPGNYAEVMGVEWFDGDDCASIQGQNLTAEDSALVGMSAYENERCRYCSDRSCE